MSTLKWSCLFRPCTNFLLLISRSALLRMSGPALEATWYLKSALRRVFRRALAELETLSGHDWASPLFCSTPVDCPPGSPDFVNAVVRMDVEDWICPGDFLKSLQAMESTLVASETATETRPVHSILI